MEHDVSTSSTGRKVHLRYQLRHTRSDDLFGIFPSPTNISPFSDFQKSSKPPKSAELKESSLVERGCSSTTALHVYVQRE